MSRQPDQVQSTELDIFNIKKCSKISFSFQPIIFFKIKKTYESTSEDFCFKCIFLSITEKDGNFHLKSKRFGTPSYCPGVEKVMHEPKSQSPSSFFKRQHQSCKFTTSHLTPS